MSHPHRCICVHLRVSPFLSAVKLSYLEPSASIWIGKEIVNANKKGDARRWTRMFSDLAPIWGITNGNRMTLSFPSVDPGRRLEHDDFRLN